jgi:hypothetical protein
MKADLHFTPEMRMTHQAGDEADVDAVVDADQVVVEDVGDVGVQETNSHPRSQIRATCMDRLKLMTMMHSS